jgi:hypothetical protein
VFDVHDEISALNFRGAGDRLTLVDFLVNVTALVAPEHLAVREQPEQHARHVEPDRQSPRREQDIWRALEHVRAEVREVLSLRHGARRDAALQQ